MDRRHLCRRLDGRDREHPFTAFGDLEGCDLVIASVGLALAGLGAAAAIYAVSTVLEPQDISFGELKKRLKGDVTLNTWQKLFPGKTTTAQLVAIVNAEKEAFFGPGGKLDDLYAALLAAEGVLHKAKVAGAKASVGTAAKRKTAEATTNAAQLEVDRLDGRYMGLLALAALYDIRRKFMVARRIIVIAALLVVGGVTLYFGVVSAKADEDSGGDAAATAAESVALHPC